MELFGSHFHNHNHIKVPKPLKQFVTKSVLVETFEVFS